jgi:hypothetical protein
MTQGFRRRRVRPVARSRRRWRPRRRLSGCLLVVLVLIIVLIALSVLFGGFQKGTRTGGLGPAAPVRISAAG